MSTRSSPTSARNSAHELGDLRPVGGELGDQAVVVVVARPPRRVGRVVAPPVVLDRLAQGVDAEPVDPARGPEAQHREHRVAHGRVAPVEVRLLGQVGVVVGAAGRGVARPRAPAEHADPVGRLVAPQVERLAALRIREPRVAVGGVVRDVVEDQPQAEPARLGGERVEVRERAEDRVDVAVIADVVAEVGHRRGVDRRQPDAVHAEPAQVLQAGAQPRQVPDPVAVGVLEGAGIDLVDDAALPPGRPRGGVGGARQRYACNPVIAPPSTSVWISAVPS